jgi:hypothetical protein
MPSLAGNGGAAFAARGVSNGGSSPMHAVADSWLVQKLKNEWSSCDLGPLLTKERLADVVGSFPHLDTPIKVRFWSGGLGKGDWRGKTHGALHDVMSRCDCCCRF